MVARNVFAILLGKLVIFGTRHPGHTVGRIDGHHLCGGLTAVSLHVQSHLSIVISLQSHEMHVN